jgi:hypothetical protein
MRLLGHNLPSFRTPPSPREKPQARLRGFECGKDDVRIFVESDHAVELAARR